MVQHNCHGMTFPHIHWEKNPPWAVLAKGNLWLSSGSMSHIIAMEWPFPHIPRMFYSSFKCFKDRNKRSMLVSVYVWLPHISIALSHRLPLVSAKVQPRGIFMRKWAPGNSGNLIDQCCSPLPAHCITTSHGWCRYHLRHSQVLVAPKWYIIKMSIFLCTCLGEYVMATYSAQNFDCFHLLGRNIGMFFFSEYSWGNQNINRKNMFLLFLSFKTFKRAVKQVRDVLMCIPWQYVGHRSTD